MHKLNIGLIAAVVVFVLLNIGQFLFWKNTNESVAEQYTSEIANLEQTIAGYGSEVTVYTVTSAVKAGDEIEPDNIEPMKMYSSLMTDQYVTDTTLIEGKYFKIAVAPGTPLMNNMVMDEELDDSMRDRDIMLDRLTVGLHEGDYIDIRMTMPYGDDYVVIPHKRIYAINDGTIKLYLNEYEWNVYQGALIDYYLNKQYGCTIYGDKYVEPGLQQEARAFYAVPTNIAALLQKNPNIIDKEGAASLNDWRQSLEELLVLFRDDEDTIDADGGRLSSERATMNQAVEGDRQTQKEKEEEQAQLDAEMAEQEEGEVGDDFWDEDVSTANPEEDIANGEGDPDVTTTGTEEGGETP